MELDHNQNRPEGLFEKGLDMRCALYLRMSRDSQDTSIKDQRDALVAYTKSRDYAIVAEYIDEGISGDATEKRLGFQKMIADCPAKSFELVLCWDQDRFGRFDPLEAGYWVKPMRDAGVVLETIAQGRVDWNDFAGRLVWSVSQEAKHAYLRDLARNSLRGNIARAKLGKFVGTPPFGYEMGPDGFLVLGDESEMAAVRRVFELRLLRLGYRVISQRLNDECVPSPRGNRWSHDAVKTILDREAYTGTLVYGKRHDGKYATLTSGIVGPKTADKANSDPIRVRNAHPRLIDEATWLSVVAMRKDPPKPHANKRGDGAPLAGLLRCGMCGGTMYSQNHQHKNGNRFPVYVCSEYMLSQSCGCCRVKQSEIHDIVSGVIRKKMLLGSREALMAAIEKERSAHQPKVTAASFKTKLAALSKQIEAATNRLLIVDERLVGDLQSRVLAMKEQRRLLVQEMENSASPEKLLTAKEMADRLWSVVSVIETGDATTVRATLGAMFDYIRLDFVKGTATKRGQSYTFIGGEIFGHDSSKPWASLLDTPRFMPTRMRFTA